MSLPSHYKAEGQGKGEACLICQTQTRGGAKAVYLGFGEYVFLCPGHASEEFRRKRNGRDFALSIWKASRSAGRMTKARRKALDRIFGELNGPKPDAPTERQRPGSYAWPGARKAVEDACAKGAQAIGSIRDVALKQIGKMALRTVSAPSDRTLRRWRADRRWAEPPGAPARG